MNKGWLKCSLGKVISIKHGYSFKGEYFSQKGKYIILTPGNFHEEGGFRNTPGKEKYYIGQFPVEYICSKNDLIVVMTEQAEGLLGSTALVPAGDTFLHNQRIGLISIDKGVIDRDFVNYLFRTKNVRNQIRDSASGSKVKHTSPSKIYDVRVELPPIDDQKRIGHFLSILDTKIELNNKICSELESLAQDLYRYWFTQFDFPDERGRPYRSSGGKMVWNEKLGREIPEGWEVHRLLDHLQINQNIINPSRYDFIGYLDTGNLTNNVVSFIQHIDMKSETPPSRARRKVEPNDILFSTVRPNQDHFGLIKEPGSNLVASTGFTILSSKIDKQYNEIFYLFITLPENLKFLQNIANTNVSAYPSINPEDIAGLMISLPKNLLVLSSMANTFSTIFSTITRFQKESQELASLRDFLLPLLMNGQVKVGDSCSR